MSRTIRQGDTGKDVRECQSLLCTHGFVTGVDGVFGSGTAKQVKLFQGSQGLTADGIVGVNTWGALREAPATHDPLSWADVVRNFSEMLPQQYLLSGAQCPSNPPGVSLKRIGYETTNCVLFTSWLLSNSFPNVKFTGTQWSDWMVSKDNTDAVQTVPGYGPKVIKEWGWGTTSPGEGPWLVQMFTESSGHSLIVVDHDKETDKILTLEALGSIKGAGWREIGPLRETLNPGPNWKNKVDQTWGSRFKGVKALHMIRLRISIESIRDWLQEGT